MLRPELVVVEALVAAAGITVPETSPNISRVFFL
jgi:hypothetical protein